MANVKKLIGIGDKLEISIYTKLNNRRQLISRVTNIISEKVFEILTPNELIGSIHLSRGSVLEIVVVKDDAIYNFKTIIIEKLNDNISVLKVEVTSEINKIQRRSFFRLDVIKSFEGREVEDIKEYRFGERFTGSIIDISGGGVLLNTNKDLLVDNVIELTFKLSNEQDIVIYCLILRKSSNSISKYLYEYGIKFVNITESERTLIMKYIFEEQRKQIKKGRIQ